MPRLSKLPGVVHDMKSSISRNLLLSIFLAAGVLSLAACNHGDSAEKKSGQTLVKVNGDELTVVQLNEELRQATVKEASAEKQRKQLLEALVDRQLLVSEAVKNKLDRDVNVVQAIERAKAQILAQAFLQSKLVGAAKPSDAEIDAYYKEHQDLFAQRKLFEMRQFVVASKDSSKELNAAMDEAKSLDEIGTWLDNRKIEYAKSQIMRSSTELPAQILAKMQGTEKTQLFILHGDNTTLLMSVTYVKDMPVTRELAGPEIARFLSNKKTQEVADAEIKRLRSVAKIEYSNPADVPGDVGKPAAAAASTPAAPVAPVAPNAVQPKPDADLGSIK